ncbi:hypothetical protein BO70DRAFT_92190 [Aspergillus heteromorphus CBS 117.55]|uniref:Uncharacterized protein n=1 Tax=Aspergillus heteromorphus CBS 117.55 TaxID=1448321 RepID=A0A317VTF2_9EURO|nr:uncharacterized protein BO70DRAFT_92190 [Aspergillus heteromorphus CBS 117.55]PWY76222.1 hypothetical protein BO70DRAFT_92190 [Aspergillus heteromorphus CBS 117.55]
MVRSPNGCFSFSLLFDYLLPKKNHLLSLVRQVYIFFPLLLLTELPSWPAFILIKATRPWLKVKNSRR